MNRCHARPYEGNEPYIFVSYCHKDQGRVFPVIEYFAHMGYRIWYDEGINPGTEWPEVIAGHLSKCAVFMAFLSENSLNSHNCRKEFNFAVLKNKPSLTVLLEEVQLSPGMELQMASIQSVLKYIYQNQEEFLHKLLSSPCLSPCLGEPNPDIEISEESTQIPPEEQEPSSSFSDSWFLNPSDSLPHSADSQKAQAIDPLPTPIPPRTKPVFFLLREDNGEKIAISHTEFKIGRKKELCDYALENIAVVSRVHAIFFLEENHCFVMDNHSLNKVYVNEVDIPAGTKHLLSENDFIQIGSVCFTVTVEEVEVESE